MRWDPPLLLLQRGAEVGWGAWGRGISLILFNKFLILSSASGKKKTIINRKVMLIKIRFADKGVTANTQVRRCVMKYL